MISEGTTEKTISVYIENRGCRRRGLDASRLAAWFQMNGCVITRKPGIADTLILMTCGCCSANAETAFKRVRALRGFGGELIVLGCIPAMFPKRLAEEWPGGRALATKDLDRIDSFFPHFAVPFRDIPDANHEYSSDPSYAPYVYLLDRFLGGKESGQSFALKIYRLAKSHVASRRGREAKLRISNGCRGSCTYCAIRHATGKLHSKPLEACIIEYRRVLGEGCRRVRLLAEESGCYGVDFGSSLPELLQRLGEVDCNHNVTWKIGNMNPVYAIDQAKELLPVIRSGKIDTIDFGIQSGNGRVLKMMNRFADIERLERLLSDFKDANPKIRLMADFMVGFPTETEEEFRDTVKFMLRARLDYVKIFPYSDMEGSRSSKMAGKLSYHEIRERLVIARKKAARKLAL